MICKPYKAIVSERNCITRQHIIATGHTISGWGNNGREELHDDACRTCEKGKKLYEQAKADGRLSQIKLGRRRRSNSKARDIAEMAFIAYRAQNACVGW
jgi:hypothetical protein